MLGIAEISSAQDIIVLNNETVDELEVKVTEVSDTEVKYKKWSYQDGPTFTMPTDKIFVIKYQNGDKQRFDVVQKKTEKVKKSDKKSKSKKTADKTSKKEKKTTPISTTPEITTPSVTPVTATATTPIKVSRSSEPALSDDELRRPFAEGSIYDETRAIYYFPETGEAFSGVAVDLDFLYGKYFLDNVYAAGGLGIAFSTLWLKDDYKTSALKEFNNTSASVTVPLVAGYTLPLKSNLCLNFFTGPHFRYIVYGDYNGVQYKDLPESEKFKSFGANWDFGAKIRFGDISVGGMYSLYMAKGNDNAGVWSVMATFSF